MAVKIIKHPCPAADCKVMAYAEIDIAQVPKEERKNLLKAAHKRLEAGLKKHHDDGHPKDGK